MAITAPHVKRKARRAVVEDSDDESDVGGNTADGRPQETLGQEEPSTVARQVPGQEAPATASHQPVVSGASAWDSSRPPSHESAPPTSAPAPDPVAPLSAPSVHPERMACLNGMGSLGVSGGQPVRSPAPLQPSTQLRSTTLPRIRFFDEECLPDDVLASAELEAGAGGSFQHLPPRGSIGSDGDAGLSRPQARHSAYSQPFRPGGGSKPFNFDVFESGFARSEGQRSGSSTTPCIDLTTAGLHGSGQLCVDLISDQFDDECLPDDVLASIGGDASRPSVEESNAPFSASHHVFVAAPNVPNFESLLAPLDATRRRTPLARNKATRNFRVRAGPWVGLRRAIGKRIYRLTTIFCMANACWCSCSRFPRE